MNISDSLSHRLSSKNVIKFLYCPYFRLSSEQAIGATVPQKSPTFRFWWWEIVFQYMFHAHTLPLTFKNDNKASMTKGVPPVYSRLFDLVLCIVVIALRFVVFYAKMNFIKNANKDMADILVGKQVFFCRRVWVRVSTKEGKLNPTHIECELVNNNNKKSKQKPRQKMCELQTTMIHGCHAICSMFHPYVHSSKWFASV